MSMGVKEIIEKGDIPTLTSSLELGSIDTAESIELFTVDGFDLSKLDGSSNIVRLGSAWTAL